MSQARLGQGVKRLTKLDDQDSDRLRSLRIRRQIGERPAGKFLDHFVCAVAPSAGREDLGHVITGKFAQEIVDCAIRLGSRRIERKYAPSAVGLTNGHETLANGAR